MLLHDIPQTFLFTFRPNGPNLAEVLVEQLAGYDPSPAGDAYKRSWVGPESDLGPMLTKLGFTALDVQGVTASLKSHREADRRLDVTPEQLQDSGFQEVV